MAIDHRAPDVLAAMATFAGQLLAGREAHKAKLAGEGKPIPPAVDDGIRLARAINAIWQWAVDPAQPPYPQPDMHGWWNAWPLELATETARVAERARAKVTDDDAATHRTAELAEALAWYMALDRYDHRIVQLLDLDRRMAAKARAPMAEAA